MNTKKQLNIVHMQYYSLENQYFMWIQILMKGEHTAGIKAHELCLPIGNKLQMQWCRKQRARPLP